MNTNPYSSNHAAKELRRFLSTSEPTFSDKAWSVVGALTFAASMVLVMFV